MKKSIFVAAFVAVSMVLNAQVVFNETFDTNDHGWQEFKDADASCFIIDGAMAITTKDGGAFTSCYAAYEPQQDFEMNIDVLTKRRDITFGLVFDYMDDSNYRYIRVDNAVVRYYAVREGNVVSYRRNGIKEIKNAKKNGIQLTLKQSAQKLTFFVDGMQALELRYVDMKYSGIGIWAGAGQKLSFDNFVIKQ